ncbi:hypothetical protein PoB_000936800 [Plakobranchus ocellatus]|uniref:Uncharacterized protein n=1 Tax=Plakobranchus ocellatus TaxID=259542 RepID=A0AAV3YK29_9GAST|nr:hypothetical protein PoB_000936800 [Plakobranchus ocellatus]
MKSNLPQCWQTMLDRAWTSDNIAAYLLNQPRVKQVTSKFYQSQHDYSQNQLLNMFLSPKIYVKLMRRQSRPQIWTHRTIAECNPV